MRTSTKCCSFTKTINMFLPNIFKSLFVILRIKIVTLLNIVYQPIYCKSTIYFRRHNNIMVYLLNLNITYIIILATCFDSYESSSGINFKNYCTYCFTVFCLTVFCLSRTIVRLRQKL